MRASYHHGLVRTMFSILVRNVLRTCLGLFQSLAWNTDYKMPRKRGFVVVWLELGWWEQASLYSAFRNKYPGHTFETHSAHVRHYDIYMLEDIQVLDVVYLALCTKMSSRISEQAANLKEWNKTVKLYKCTRLLPLTVERFRAVRR